MFHRVLSIGQKTRDDERIRVTNPKDFSIALAIHITSICRLKRACTFTVYLCIAEVTFFSNQYALLSIRGKYQPRLLFPEIFPALTFFYTPCFRFTDIG